LKGGGMVLDALVDQLGGWLRDVRAERLAAKDKLAANRDQRAAQVLYDASVLLASMQAYDNAARSAYRSAYVLASQDPAVNEDAAIREDRRQAYRKLQDFEDLHELYRRAGRAIQQLATESEDLASEAWAESLLALISCGNKFQRITHDVRDAKQKYEQAYRYGYSTSEFMRATSDGSSSKDVATYAKRMMSRIDPLTDLLDQADKAYSALCVSARSAHNLPPLPVFNP
jgi:hypothetical protein